MDIRAIQSSQITDRIETTIENMRYNKIIQPFEHPDSKFEVNPIITMSRTVQNTRIIAAHAEGTDSSSLANLHKRPQYTKCGIEYTYILINNKSCPQS